jgi:hypothetical protein
MTLTLDASPHLNPPPFCLSSLQAGAAALIIVDDGSCSETFECGGWLGRKADGPLAMRDEREAWVDVHIPVVLVTLQNGERLMRQLDTSTIEVPGIGRHVHVPLYK